jgi:hypothetical protein
MNLFRQSIVVFGFALPLLAVVAVIGSFAFLRGKVVKSFDNKAGYFQSYNSDRLRAMEIEAGIGKKRTHTALWAETIRQETISTVSGHLQELSKKLPSREFQQTSFTPSNNAGGFGSVSAQQSVAIDFSYRATFRSMQQAFLDLESRMPQLQLNDLKISRSPQSNTLNFQVTYTAWEE